MSAELGGGSLTALPIIETQAGDVSAYIPTNVISITDGQIYLESDLFYKGFRPAINVGLSVSRVGGNAQIKAMKKVAGTLRLELAQYRQMASFAQFATDLDKATKRQLDKGARMMELLKQRQYRPEAVERQIVSLFAASADEGFLMDVAIPDVGRFEHDLLDFIDARHSDIFTDIREKKVLDDAIRARLVAAINEFKALFNSK